MINKGALPKYSQVDMMLGALLCGFCAEAVTKMQPDPRDPLVFQEDTLQKDVLNKCVTTDGLGLWDLEESCKAPGVSVVSVPASVRLQHSLVAIYRPTLLNIETAVPVQATEEIVITKAANTIGRKIDNMTNACKAWTFQMSKANERGYGGYQTAMAYTIQADHPPPHTPLHFPPPNILAGLNWQQHPQQGFKLYINGYELGHIGTLYPDVDSNPEPGVVNCNRHGRLT